MMGRRDIVRKPTIAKERLPREPAWARSELSEEVRVETREEGVGVDIEAEPGVCQWRLHSDGVEGHLTEFSDISGVIIRKRKPRKPRKKLRQTSLPYLPLQLPQSPENVPEHMHHTPLCRSSQLHPSTIPLMDE